MVELGWQRMRSGHKNTDTNECCVLTDFWWSGGRTVNNNDRCRGWCGRCNLSGRWRRCWSTNAALVRIRLQHHFFALTTFAVHSFVHSCSRSLNTSVSIGQYVSIWEGGVGATTSKKSTSRDLYPFHRHWSNGKLRLLLSPFWHCFYAFHIVMDHVVCRFRIYTVSQKMHQLWRAQNYKLKFVLFSVSGLKDKKLIKSKPTWKLKLESLEYFNQISSKSILIILSCTVILQSWYIFWDTV